MLAIILEISSAYLNKSSIFSLYDSTVSLIKQSQYFVSFADSNAIA